VSCVINVYLLTYLLTNASTKVSAILSGKLVSLHDLIRSEYDVWHLDTLYRSVGSMVKIFRKTLCTGTGNFSHGESRFFAALEQLFKTQLALLVRICPPVAVYNDHASQNSN